MAVSQCPEGWAHARPSCSPAMTVQGPGGEEEELTVPPAIFVMSLAPRLQLSADLSVWMGRTMDIHQEAARELTGTFSGTLPENKEGSRLEPLDFVGGADGT
jgi:hypothetical protein